MIVQEVQKQAAGVLVDVEKLRSGKGATNCQAVYKLTAVAAHHVEEKCLGQLWGPSSDSYLADDDETALPLPTRSRAPKISLPPPPLPVPLPQFAGPAELPPHAGAIYAKLFDCLVLCRRICRAIARKTENYFTTFDESIYCVELVALARHVLALLQVRYQNQNTNPRMHRKQL